MNQNCLYRTTGEYRVAQSVVGAGLITLVITDTSEEIVTEIDKVGVKEVITHQSDNITTMAATSGVKGDANVQSKLIIHISS